MEKLLHDRLRDGAAKTDLTFILDIGDEKVDFRSKHALAIADEIERYYIPRPRFEDGEPIQDSDLEEIGAMATCRVYTDGSWVFDPDKYEDERNPKPWDKQEGRLGDYIERPTPKVYDADGVEIKVGQVLWNITGNKALRILALDTNFDLEPVIQTDDGRFNPDQLTHEKPVFDADGVRICNGDTVWCLSNGGEKGRVDDFVSVETVSVIWEVDGSCTNGVAAKNLTHREPDSQQRIDDDARKLVESISSRYEIDDTIWANDGVNGVGATTLLDEIGELLSRQRALIERGA